jgi:glutamate racemase
MSDGAIGVFDSGVGGLSVLREIRRALPQEDLLYVADSGHAPYGDQPTEFIEGRASAVVRFLLDARVKAITIACNTATVVAVEKLRRWSPVPIIAIEPAIKPATTQTKNGVIGVLATSRTLASGNVARLVDQYASHLQVHLQPCPGLVEQVEHADLDSAQTRALVRQYLAPLLEKGVDTLVLGCTHYPFLAPLIREIAGPGVAIIDPAPAVARHLGSVLGAAGLLRAAGEPPQHRFFTTGRPADLADAIDRWCGSRPAVNTLEWQGERLVSSVAVEARRPSKSP